MIGASPTHAPGAPTSLDPTTGLPEIVGADELAGLPPGVATTDVAALVASVVPPLLLAETRTRMRLPMSADTTVYVWRVAPSIVAHVLSDESSPPAASHLSQR